MTGKSFLRVCLLFACVVFLVSMLSSNVLADDINTASQPDATTSEELFELETFALAF